MSEESAAKLLVEGVRIIMEILVDEHHRSLTRERRAEIQQWYDRVQRIMEDASVEE